MSSNDWVEAAGGPAFPQGAVTDHLGNTYPLFGGMSLRDWFAGQALAGMNASPALLEAVTSKEAGEGSHYERLCRHAYRQADAMLAERQKGGAS
jgi:hypothetical protein